MQFILLVIPTGYQHDDAPAVPPADAVAEMMVFNQKLSDAGVLLQLNGLHPPAVGARVRFSADAEPEVVDGPFADAKNLVGGYWVIDVASRDAAITWARQAPMAADDMIEVRQIQEMSDFPDEIKELIPEALRHLSS